MDTYMVTCGRGLDAFARQEILEKIPGAVDLRHLGEGKLAFRVCQATFTTDASTSLDQECTAARGSLGDDRESRDTTRETREHSVTSTTTEELPGIKRLVAEQKVATQRAIEPPAIHRATGPPATHRATEPPATHRATEPPATHRATEPPATHRATGPPTTHRATGPPTTHRATGPPAIQRATGPPATHRATGPPTTRRATRPPVTHRATEPPATHRVTGPPATPIKEEDQWVTAASHIFKLRLVERVFTLLHCEDIGSKDEQHHAGVGNSRPEDVLKEYENKIKNLIANIKWNYLSLKLKRLRGCQNGKKSTPVWCQDPDSCPGTLRRRQTRKVLEEKRAACVSSGEAPGSFPKRQRKDNNKTGYLEKNVKVHETHGISDNDKKIPKSSTVCKYENAKIQGILWSNTSENHDVCISNEIRPETALSKEAESSQRSQKQDSKNVCDGLEITNTCEDMMVTPADINPANRKVEIIPEESKSPQSKVFKENNCLSSQTDVESEEVKKDKNVSRNSTEHASSTFRVSSRVSGPNKHILTVKWINHILGQQLVKAMVGWVPDWRQPIVDLYVNITSSHFIVGAAMSSRPLSLRTYIPHLTLRSTISHLMARLSCVPPEAIVLDPMCGGGSILVETAISFDVSHVIASDSSREQLEVARCNLHNLRVPVTLLQADAQELPLQDSSISTVLCDFPFGQKHKLTTESQRLLTDVLREMHRVLVYRGRAVFLLSPRQTEVVSQLAHDRTKTSSAIIFGAGGSLILLETHFVSLGETSAYVVVLAKEQLSPESSKEKGGIAL